MEIFLNDVFTNKITVKQKKLNKRSFAILSHINFCHLKIYLI